MRPPPFDLPQLPKGLRFEDPKVADPCFRAFGSTIEIFDAIGGKGVTVPAVTAALRPLAGRDVVVKINSPGGNYYQGVSIYNALRQHDGNVTVQVMGIAASAASIIAMAGDRIEMARNSELMVHRVWSLTVGNAGDHAEAKGLLERLDHSAAETYAARTGQPIAEIAAMMAAETYIRADQAIKLGFADALLDRDAMPKKRAVNEEAAANSNITIANKGELVALLRRSGLAKAAAQRVAAGGFSALAEDNQPDTAAIAAKLNALASRLEN